MCLKKLKAWWHSDYEMYQLKDKREINLHEPITKLIIPSGCRVTLEGGELTITLEAK